MAEHFKCFQKNTDNTVTLAKIILSNEIISNRFLPAIYLTRIRKILFKQSHKNISSDRNMRLSISRHFHNIKKNWDLVIKLFYIKRFAKKVG